VRRLFFCTCALTMWVNSAFAGQLENIYADIDAKIMSNNLNVVNYYSPDAVIISSDGGVHSIDESKELMMNIIRAGGRIEVSQSRILGKREIRTAMMGSLKGIVVFSEDYTRTSIADPKHPNQRVFEEDTQITTRVFDTTEPSKWLIISEQSSEVEANR